MKGLKVVFALSTLEGAFNGLTTKDFDQVNWDSHDMNGDGVNVINYISYKDGQEYFLHYLGYELVG